MAKKIDEIENLDEKIKLSAENKQMIAFNNTIRHVSLL